MRRELMIRRIKEGCLDTYIEKHNAYWPELKQEMIEGGFKNITCFLDGYNLFVYREYDEVIFTSKGSAHFVLNAKWAEVMGPILESTVIRGKEVFHLDGRLEN